MPFDDYHADPEKWLPLPMHEGLYEVSSFGRVRSLDRTVDRGGYPMKISGFMLKLIPHYKTGYLQVTICKNAKSKTRSVNEIVCTTFHGPKPLGAHAAHEDGVFLNNSSSNLSWKSVKENDADKDRHGTRLKGAKVHFAKMDVKEVLAIRSLRETGMGWAAIGRNLGVSSDMARYACNGRAWKHIAENAHAI